MTAATQQLPPQLLPQQGVLSIVIQDTPKVIKRKQLVIVLDTTATLNTLQYSTIFSLYIKPILNATKQKQDVTWDYGLVCFRDYPPFADYVVSSSPLTQDMKEYQTWLAAVRFVGGGYAENAIEEGLCAAFRLLLSGASMINSKIDERYVILISNSQPHNISCRSCFEGGDSNEHVKRMLLHKIYVSVISPRKIPELKEIFNSGKVKPGSPSVLEPMHVEEKDVSNDSNLSLLRGLSLLPTAPIIPQVPHPTVYNHQVTATQLLAGQPAISQLIGQWPNVTTSQQTIHTHPSQQNGHPPPTQQNTHTPQPLQQNIHNPAQPHAQPPAHTPQLQSQSQTHPQPHTTPAPNIHAPPTAVHPHTTNTPNGLTHSVIPLHQTTPQNPAPGVQHIAQPSQPSVHPQVPQQNGHPPPTQQNTHTPQPLQQNVHNPQPQHVQQPTHTQPPQQNGFPQTQHVQQPTYAQPPPQNSLSQSPHNVQQLTQQNGLSQSPHNVQQPSPHTPPTVHTPQPTHVHSPHTQLPHTQPAQSIQTLGSSPSVPIVVSSSSVPPPVPLVNNTNTNTNTNTNPLNTNNVEGVLPPNAPQVVIQFPNTPAPGPVTSPATATPTPTQQQPQQPQQQQQPHVIYNPSQQQIPQNPATATIVRTPSPIIYNGYFGMNTKSGQITCPITITAFRPSNDLSAFNTQEWPHVLMLGITSSLKECPMKNYFKTAPLCQISLKTPQNGDPSITNNFMNFVKNLQLTGQAAMVPLDPANNTLLVTVHTEKYGDKSLDKIVGIIVPKIPTLRPANPNPVQGNPTMTNPPPSYSPHLASQTVVRPPANTTIYNPTMTTPPQPQLQRNPSFGTPLPNTPPLSNTLQQQQQQQQQQQVQTPNGSMMTQIPTQQTHMQQQNNMPTQNVMNPQNILPPQTMIQQQHPQQQQHMNTLPQQNTLQQYPYQNMMPTQSMMPSQNSIPIPTQQTHMQPQNNMPTQSLMPPQNIMTPQIMQSNPNQGSPMSGSIPLGDSDSSPLPSTPTDSAQGAMMSVDGEPTNKKQRRSSRTTTTMVANNTTFSKPTTRGQTKRA